MNKFCQYCGRELKEGEVCNCKNKDIKNVFKSIIDIIKRLFINPKEVLETYLTDNNFIVGIVLIVITSFIRGIYSVLSLYHNYSKFNYYKYSKGPNYFDEFFKSFGLSLVRYVAIVFIIYLIIKVILKDNMSWKKIVSSVGISLVVVMLGYIVNCFLTFSDAKIVTYISSYIDTFMNIFNTIILYEAIKGLVKIDKNKLIISIPLVFVGTSIVMNIINKLIS